ncbi:MAG: hypothetical protein PGN37_20725 [Mycobacterium kyogaense]|uniref:hypothetical protein n=1 Tax=Mycobacterium kyogaense TaxID=2212479 RepID=UPI002FF5A3D2
MERPAADREQRRRELDRRQEQEQYARGYQVLDALIVGERDFDGAGRQAELRGAEGDGLERGFVVGQAGQAGQCDRAVVVAEDGGDDAAGGRGVSEHVTDLFTSGDRDRDALQLGGVGIDDGGCGQKLHRIALHDVRQRGRRE